MVDIKRVVNEIDEIVGSETYAWLKDEIGRDYDSILRCLATEPDAGTVKYRQGQLYGIKCVLGVLEEPHERLRKRSTLGA